MSALSCKLEQDWETGGQDVQEAIIVVPHNPCWANEFMEIGRRIRASMGESAIRIDHIGSTSIPGLDAKPIIDIQISVRSLDKLDWKPFLEQLGYMHRENNPDQTKRYFRESGSMRRTHIHVRKAGSWSEQCALLFRDYLRVHPQDSQCYAREKYRLSELYRHERERYVTAKEPIIWEIMRKASLWSQQAGWEPGTTDI